MPAALAGVPEFDQAGNPLECDSRGRHDTGWGIAIMVPAGLLGCNLEIHDVIIPLGSRDEDRWIMSSGEYNATCETRLSDVVTDALSGDEYLDQRLVGRKKTRFAGLKAESAILKYRRRDTGVEMVHEVVTLFSYSLSLETPVSTYEQDGRVYNSIVQHAKVASGGV